MKLRFFKSQRRLSGPDGPRHSSDQNRKFRKFQFSSGNFGPPEGKLPRCGISVFLQCLKFCSGECLTPLVAERAFPTSDYWGRTELARCAEEMTQESVGISNRLLTPCHTRPRRPPRGPFSYQGVSTRGLGTRQLFYLPRNPRVSRGRNSGFCLLSFVAISC